MPPQPPGFGAGFRASVAVRLGIVLLAALLLAGCGKKGSPVPPPDQPNTYPRVYPNG